MKMESNFVPNLSHPLLAVSILECGFTSSRTSNAFQVKCICLQYSPGCLQYSRNSDMLGPRGSYKWNNTIKQITFHLVLTKYVWISLFRGSLVKVWITEVPVSDFYFIMYYTGNKPSKCEHMVGCSPSYPSWRTVSKWKTILMLNRKSLEMWRIELLWSL